MTVEIYQIDGTVVRIKDVKVSLLTSSGVLTVTTKGGDKKDRRTRNYILQNLIYYETIPDETEPSDTELREIAELGERIEELKSKIDKQEKESLCDYCTLFSPFRKKEN